jgi:hypothetical protein
MSLATCGFSTKRNIPNLADDIPGLQCRSNPSLRPQSSQNGNIRGVSQRLYPNFGLIPGNREYRDRSPNCRSPPLAGISATIPDLFSEPRTAWLATQC